MSDKPTLRARRDWLKPYETFVAAASGIVLLISLAQLLYGAFKPLPPWTYGVSYCVFILAIMAVLYIEVRRRRKAELRYVDLKGKIEELDKRINGWKQLPSSLHSILHDVRDVIITTWEQAGDEATAPQKAAIRKMLESVLAALANGATAAYGHPCAACVKVFQSTARGTLRTLARDLASKLKRDDADRVYSVDKNTAFANIMREQVKTFYNGDLMREGSLYHNEHADYIKCYRCVEVVPIMMGKKENGDRSKDILGFLCLDAKVPDAFDEDTSTQLLACVADSLYPIILIYFNLDTEKKEGCDVPERAQTEQK